MFYLRWPSDEQVRAALRPVAEAAVTHPYEGVTRTDLFEAPRGFVLDRYGVALGHGEPVFEAARAALQAFGNYPASFTRVVRLEETCEPGTVFGTVASHFGFASMNPCRIVSMIDEPDSGRFGFCLGTLPGHAATGEERFLVSTDPESGDVRYDVQAISRPAVRLSQLGRPAMRRVQARFRAESCASMQRLAHAG